MSASSAGHMLCRPWAVSCVLSETQLENTKFSSVSRCQLEVASGLGMGARVYFLLRAGTPSGLDLVGSCACCRSLREFICTSVLLWALLLLHTFFSLLYVFIFYIKWKDLLWTRNPQWSFFCSSWREFSGLGFCWNLVHGIHFKILDMGWIVSN